MNRPVAPLIQEAARVEDAVDTGARSLAADIAAALDEVEEHPAIITTVAIENRSHATHREFTRFLQRFTNLLEQSSDQSIGFVMSDGPVPYELTGSAYLMTRDGFDVWEVYLQLKPVEGSWTIWQPAAPIHVLRQARPGDPQIRYISSRSE